MAIGGWFLWDSANIGQSIMWTGMCATVGAGATSRVSSLSAEVACHRWKQALATAKKATYIANSSLSASTLLVLGSTWYLTPELSLLTTALSLSFLSHCRSLWYFNREVRPALESLASDVTHVRSESSTF